MTFQNPYVTPDPLPGSREAALRDFLAAWLPLVGGPGQLQWRFASAEEMAQQLMQDPGFPGVELCDILGRPDARAIESVVTGMLPSPYGYLTSLEMQMLQDALVMACSSHGVQRRNGYLLAGMLAAAIAVTVTAAVRSAGPPAQ